MTNETRSDLDLATVLARSDEVLEAEIDGEAVMMSIEKGEYYGLDATGTAIWKLLEKPRSVGEIFQVMQERYDVEPDVCRHDVETFLGDLLSDGTLRIVDGTVEPEG